MPPQPNSARGSLLRAVPFRHAASVAVTLVLNAVVVLVLVTWAGRRRPEASPPLRVTALSVVRAEPEPVEFESPRPAVEPVVAQPEPAPALPALPQPVLPAPMPSLEAPSPIQMVLEQRMNVPPYEAEAVGPVVAKPGPLPSRPPARPAAVRPGRPSYTRGPVLLDQPGLSDYYPRSALLRGVTGRTRIRLTVDATGRVTDVQLVASKPAGVFEHAARRVGRVLRFRPAVRAGKPVPSVVSLNLVWKVE